MPRLATSPTLQDAYTDALPASRALYERAQRLFGRIKPSATFLDRRNSLLRKVDEHDVRGHDLTSFQYDRTYAVALRGSFAALLFYFFLPNFYPQGKIWKK